MAAPGQRLVVRLADRLRKCLLSLEPAPIFTPTLASAALLLGLVFLPARLWLGLWSGCALTLGVLAGYLAYGLTHHATHHWRGQGRWLMRRKQWHARHHRTGRATCCYGVSSGFWDQVFRSAR